MDRITADNHKISDPAVKKATGCTWSEWFQAIKEAEKSCSHRSGGLQGAIEVVGAVGVLMRL